MNKTSKTNISKRRSHDDDIIQSDIISCSQGRMRKKRKHKKRGGRVVRRCWVNFQCRGVISIWIRVGQGPIVLAIGAGRGCLDIFSLDYHFSFLSPFLRETARYRLKYCLNGPLNPKQRTNQTQKDISPRKALMVSPT